MGNFIWMVSYYMVTVPGTPFVNLLSRFKQMGDGTGNETVMIDSYLWATFFGIIVWICAVVGGVWVWYHLSISFLVK